jgi:hypothetical protein
MRCDGVVVLLSPVRATCVYDGRESSNGVSGQIQAEDFRRMLGPFGLDQSWGLSGMLFAAIDCSRLGHISFYAFLNW